MALVRLLQFVIVVSCKGAIKSPDTGQGYRGFRTLSLFSGIFNVARNPVTNRHAARVTPAAMRRQDSEDFNW